MKQDKKKLNDRLTNSEKDMIKMRKEYIRNVDPAILIEHFPLFALRQNLCTYMVKYDLFKKILNHKGSIVECGVHRGGADVLC